MKLTVDRPRPPILTIESGKGAGKEIMAKPTWGDDNDPLPVSVWVVVNTESGENVIDKIGGPFESIEQAEELALERATAWYDGGGGYDHDNGLKP